MYSCHHRGVADIIEGKLRAPAPRASIGSTGRPTPARTEREHAASVWVRGAFGAGWAAALGIGSLFVVALIIWSADSRSNANAADAMRLAGQLWLVAHRTPLRVQDGALTLPPLALTVVLGLILARASALVARSSRCTEVRDLGPVVASVTLPYAVIAAVLAGFARSSTITPSIGAAFVCAALVGGTFSTVGAARGAGLSRAAWGTLPEPLARTLNAAGRAALVLFAAAALLTFGSFVAHLHRYAALLNSYCGAPGKISMLLLSLMLLPNAVVFALGYLTGPGFGIGAGTSVAIGGSHLGAMPALPLVAAVPTGRAPWPVVAFCALGVLGAGVAAGRQLSRNRDVGLRERLRDVALTAAVLGIGTATVVGFAGGPGGPGRLRAVGPSPWQVGLAVSAEVAVVAAVVLAITVWAPRRGVRVSAPE
jgi:hypothetical protein